ncbi:MAG: prolyl oligopeptidase family serine peptidase, partial [Anaerolineae bacterium]|nr:prolyl oligopeptidase family serine peptidase [Anaerolineae bacterium]
LNTITGENMMKLAKTGTMIALALALVFTLAFAGMPVQAQEAGTTTYNRIDEVMDWGAVTTKLIVNLQAEVSEGVDAATFSVYVKRSDPRLEEPPLGEGDATVVDAYISDAAGNPVETGSFATLVMEIGPTVAPTSALNYDFMGSGLNDWTENVYTITQEKAIGDIEGLVATEMDQYSRLLIDDFEFAQASYEDEEFGLIELPYAYYAPAADDAQHPLIIWLHGGGEGGSDPTIPLAANKATVFVTAEVQAYFGGAYVLVPQSPTMWLDDGSGSYEGENFGIISKYTRAVQNLVESYVAENSGIDPNRIYVSGASNGGFLTVRLILDYPDFYAAAVPVCEPFNDAAATDEALAAILDMPIWFVTAATDFVVQPSTYPVKLYDRLIQAGAAHTYISYLPKVLDESGLYTNEDGSAYEYMGHWSWIYFYNNDLAQIMDGETVVGRLYGPAAHANDNAVTIMEWLAAQSK